MEQDPSIIFRHNDFEVFFFLNKEFAYVSALP